jgi:hypothetical protein
MHSRRLSRHFRRLNRIESPVFGVTTPSVAPVHSREITTPPIIRGNRCASEQRWRCDRASVVSADSEDCPYAYGAPTLDSIKAHSGLLRDRKRQVFLSQNFSQISVAQYNTTGEATDQIVAQV